MIIMVLDLCVGIENDLDRKINWAVIFGEYKLSNQLCHPF